MKIMQEMCDMFCEETQVPSELKYAIELSYMIGASTMHMLIMKFINELNSTALTELEKEVKEYMECNGNESTTH